MDIKSFAEAHLVSLNRLKSLSDNSAGSLAATWAAQQAHLRMTAMPASLSAMDSIVKRVEEDQARYRALHSPMHAQIGQLMAADQARALKMTDLVGLTPSAWESVQQLNRFADYARLGNQFRDIIDRMGARTAGVPEWLIEVEKSEARTRRLIESVLGARHEVERADWAMLEQGLEAVEVAIQELPVLADVAREPTQKRTNLKLDLSTMLALASFLLALLAYLEVLEQSAFARSQAAKDEIASEIDLAEQREFRARVAASLEILARSAASQQEYIVGPRGARLKSAISRGSLIITLEPDQRVLLLEQQGRWVRVRCLNNDELEGWTLKHYLTRQ